MPDDVAFLGENEEHTPGTGHKILYPGATVMTEIYNEWGALSLRFQVAG